ncbi:nucleoside hydrolase [Gandjariella thermophila]|uniref:Nucleoside hydrolase n=1 Tax=Gandjariella thermophila TaxID=1931992 RepID=A0A4D4JEZ6_9PSEU|nr:nucleoside hydrolase [Gandjariella thermophila]GDY32889.1 nucleoside hydrolase [Gandjariella thermophila]
MSEANGVAAGGRRPIVLDTDPGIDDALAILYLAAAPEVEIVAVGAAPGNLPTAMAADNALRLLDLVGLTDVPVALGAHTPLSQPPAISRAHGEDGLGGAAGPPSARRPVAHSAAEQLVGLARRRPGELTVVALGPLTNLALALLLERDLPRLLRAVVWMGGAIHRAGNRTPHAEFNAWQDPEAAELVLAAGFDLTMVPLDVTETARADRAWVAAVAASADPRARFASRMLEHFVDFYATTLGIEGCLLHDPLAAAVAATPALATTCEEREVTVELTGTHTRGMLVTDLRPTIHPCGYARRPVRVVVEADVSRLLDRLRHALVGAALPA